MEFTFKVANMRNEQEFCLYPYSGGDVIFLQSDKRFAQINLKTGKGIINNKNKNYATSLDLQISAMPCELPNDVKIAIQEFLWNNDGKNGSMGGGVVTYSNAKLFSN